MSLFDYFRLPRNDKKASTAPVAKERLQILLEHERAGQHVSDILPKLQREILQVVAKYYPIGQDDVTVQLDQDESSSRLELNINLPEDESRAAF